jgi:periplasmic copper chaperone A
MKRFVSMMTMLALMMTAFGSVATATAQHNHGHMGTPDASPMAGHDHMDDQGGGTSTGAFYLAITNNGDEADRLLSVETDAADTAEVHNVEMDGEVMQMVPQHDGLEIPAGERVVLEPSGYHVMMIGLTKSLVAGEEFTATLTFEHAGEVEITVPILRTEPDEGELTAEPVEAGDLVIEGVWARHAPKLDGDTPMGTPVATPEATPAS